MDETNDALVRDVTDRASDYRKAYDRLVAIVRFVCNEMDRQRPGNFAVRGGEGGARRHLDGLFKHLDDAGKAAYNVAAEAADAFDVAHDKCMAYEEEKVRR